MVSTALLPKQRWIRESTKTIKLFSGNPSWVTSWVIHWCTSSEYHSIDRCPEYTEDQNDPPPYRDDPPFFAHMPSCCWRFNSRGKQSLPIRSTANVQQPWHFSDAIGMGSTSIIEPPSGHTTSAPECIPCGCCLPPVLTITAMMGFPPPVALTGCLHPWCIRPLPVFPLPLVGLCKEQCAGQHYHGRIQGTRGTERFFRHTSGDCLLQFQRTTHPAQEL